MLIVFGVTIFFAAALLFLVQPMVGRLMLPLLGGAPGVWNTTMVFYQAVLLAGYAYAHVSIRWLGVRRQTLWHLLLLLFPLLVLPIAVPSGWLPPGNGQPALWLLGVLTVAVGLPFFVVAATSPLLQRWFAASGHRWAADPYFLYAASNAGSLLALMCYPVLIEPRLRLAEQSRWWATGYAGLVVLIAVCGLWTRRVAVREDAPVNAAAPPLTLRRRGRWLLLAFVPSSLMLGVTTYITTEIAPIPLLWVIPLGIYLLTFILAFARRKRVTRTWTKWALPVIVLALLWTVIGMLTGQHMEPLDWFLMPHLALLFVAALACHGELANDRPPPVQLTEFSLWVAGGGALGGMFTALLAPWLFPTVIEYPVAIVLACALLPGNALIWTDNRKRVWDVAGPLLLGLFTVGLIWLLTRTQLNPRWLGSALGFGVPSLLCLMFIRRPVRLALGITAILIGTAVPLLHYSHIIYQTRSFFGTHQVIADTVGGYHLLKQGSTRHGVQSCDPERRREPLSYFGRSGPLGQILGALPDQLKHQVAVVGLGAGTVACYGEPGQEWTFYEIDPAVERIARDPRFFTFLADSPAKIHVVLGDARLSLQQAPAGRFGVLILDAYCSDSLPLHLITREALALYLSKLTPDGVLAFHISARHLHLRPVLANLARDAGVSALYQYDYVDAEGLAQGLCPSQWLVMTRHPQSLEVLTMSGSWRVTRPNDSVGVWTDDYAGLFRIWTWD